MRLEISVGETTPRPLFVPGLRPQTLTAYVDGIQVAETTQGLERRHVPQLIAIAVISAIVGIAIGAGLLFGLNALFSTL